MSSQGRKPVPTDRPPASKLRIVLIVSGVFIGVTAAWLVVMYGLLKLFVGGYVVIAWLVLAGIAWLVLRRGKTKK